LRESLEKSSVKLTVTVAKKDVQDIYASVTAKYAKNALIPGFRKGHVPQAVLERKFGDALKSDAMSELIDKSLNEALEKIYKETGMKISYEIIRSKNRREILKIINIDFILGSQRKSIC